MRVPNFLTEEGSTLYKNTVGKQISPKVGGIVIEKAGEFINHDVSRALDIACGPGTVSINLAKKYPNVYITGIDSSSAMIKHCTDIVHQEGLKNARFITMNADSIQFPGESFDFAVCNLAFPFFSKPRDSMRDFLKVLAPGGKILITVPGRSTWKEFFSIGEEVSEGITEFTKPFLAKFGKVETLPETMKEAGFIELEITRHLLPFSFENGGEVLDFFQRVLALLNHMPNKMKTNITEIIDLRYPNGFTMHYEAVTVLGRRPK